MIILGIDPGIAIMGYGIVKYIGNRFEVIDYGSITTSSKMSTAERLKKIYNELNILIEKYEPEHVAIEELFFNTNAKTAMLVGQARGVAILAAINHDKKIYEYTPLQIKQGVVGYGRAEKRQVQEMIKMILNLKEVPKPDDVADALAITICHAHSGNLKQLFEMK
ncbi:MAG: crossover junction endodeoxyribonuclease RuvC [Clostridiales bacterium]|nr:crossover junction endodeoxyribonuclease RuvC [Clostridiales bacterium]